MFGLIFRCGSLDLSVTFLCGQLYTVTRAPVRVRPTKQSRTEQATRRRRRKSGVVAHRSGRRARRAMFTPVTSSFTDIILQTQPPTQELGCFCFILFQVKRRLFCRSMQDDLSLHNNQVTPGRAAHRGIRFLALILE